MVTRVLAAIAGAILLIGLGATPGHADRRVALVIGNGDYRAAGHLPDPVMDAAAMADLFRHAGFGVSTGTDLDHTAMARILDDFSARARGADLAVVYYAGYAIAVDQADYLVPVDAKLARDADVEQETLPLAEVTKRIGPARLRLVILDASRADPFTPHMQLTRAHSAIGRGLGPVRAAANTIVAFAAEPGSVAADGDGRTSPYTAALLAHLATPGVDLAAALRQVHDDVAAATSGWQTPVFYGSFSAAADRGLPIAAQQSFPDFPWPPPTPSALYVFPDDQLVGKEAVPTIGSVTGRIEAALDRGAYYDRSFYKVPGGIAMVTRLERFKPDGSPDADRWVDPGAKTSLSLFDSLKGVLFAAEPGRFRLIVFIISDQPFAANGPSLTSGKAEELLEHGFNTPPEADLQQPFSANHKVSVLVYEFEKTNRNRDAVELKPGHLTARAHLEKGNVWAGLQAASGP